MPGNNFLINIPTKNIDIKYAVATILFFIRLDGLHNFRIIEAGMIEIPFLKGAQIEGIAFNESIIYLSTEESIYSQRIFKIEDLKINFLKNIK